MPELTLGDRIGQIRRRRSMTQEELAERAGISADVIRKLEQNRRATAAIRTLHAIARALEVETSELLKQGVDLDNEDNGDASMKPFGGRSCSQKVRAMKFYTPRAATG